jgi:hypothetical protein
MEFNVLLLSVTEGVAVVNVLEGLAAADEAMV